jgi:VWFA-related protein
MSLRSSFAALLALAFGAPTLLSAQEGRMASRSLIVPSNDGVSTATAGSYAYDEPKVIFRTSTVLVQVPVVVTDKSGHRIDKLTRDQFQVLENGKQQKIATFEEILADNSPPLAPAPPGTFRNAGIEFHHAHAVTVIAIDTVNTPFMDQASGRRVLAKYLGDNLAPGQLLAMVLISKKGLQVVQGLTSNAAPLINTLKKLSGELPAMQDVDMDTQIALASGSDAPPPSNNAVGSDGFSPAVLDDFVKSGDLMYAQFQQEKAIEVTMRSFLQIAWSLSGVPGRKSLIWATSGFPFYLNSPGMVPGGRLSTLYERAMEALNDAQVSVYPVDVRGLVSMSPGTDTASHGGGATYARNLQNRTWLQNSTLATLQEFAEMTGGRAFYNSNDLAEGFRRATADSTSYYLLGYYLDTNNNKAGWRKLKVKVQEKDAEVHCRSGFLVTNASMNPQATRDLDLTFALSSPFEASGIPIWMQWRPSSGQDQKSGDKNKMGFELHIPGDVIGTQGDQNTIEIEVLAVVAASGTQSPISSPIQHTMKSALSPQALATMRITGLKYSSDLPLPAGNYDVRFVVRDNVSGRVGSISAPLTVN